MPGIHQQLQEGTPQLISNAQVLEILNQQTPPLRRRRRRDVPARHVAKQVQKYLQTTPCVRLSSSAQQQGELMQKLQCKKKRALLPPPPNTTTSTSTSQTSAAAATGFGLTHAEAIQCLNMVPTALVEIHLVVEDLPGRLSERQQQDLLALLISAATKPKGGAAATTMMVKQET